MSIKFKKTFQSFKEAISIKDERLWVIAITAIVFFSIIWLTYKEYYIQETYNYKDAELHESILSSKRELIQEVNLKGKLNDLAIGVNTPDTGRSASIMIRLVQGEYEEMQSLNFEEDGTRVWLPINLDHLRAGKFVIYLKSEDGFSHALVSSNEYFGSSQGIDGNLALRATTQVFPNHTQVRMWFLFLYLILFVFLAVTLFGQHGRYRSLKLQMIAFGMIYLCLMIRFPRLTWQTETHWESGSNFIWQTYIRGWKDSLLLDDAGYWCLFPRVISIFSIMIFGVKNALFAAQMFCAALYSAVFAKFVNKAYDCYHCDEIRFIISLFIGGTAFLPLGSLIALNNIGYVGGIYLMLCFMQDLDKISRLRFALMCIFSILMCISKFHYVVLIPIMLVALVGFKTYTKRLRIYIISCMVGPVCMLIYHVLGIAEARSFPIVGQSLATKILTVWFDFEQAILVFFKDYNENGYWGGLVYNLAILIFLVYALVLILKRRGPRKWICLGLAVWVCGILFANVSGGQVSKFIVQIADFTIATSYTVNRHEMLAIMGILLLFVIFLSDGFVFKTKSKQKNLVLLSLLMLLVFRFALRPGSGLSTSNDSNWFRFSRCLANESYAIPNGTNQGLFLVKNADVHYFGNKDIPTSNGRFLTGVSTKNMMSGDIQAITQMEIEECTLISVYAQKFRISQLDEIAMGVVDEQGEVLAMIPAIVELDRNFIGFVADQPIEGAKRIYFINSRTKQPFYLSTYLFVVSENLERGIAGTANDGGSSLYMK